jgi:predicted PP-loop superfamily ATPase
MELLKVNNMMSDIIDTMTESEVKKFRIDIYNQALEQYIEKGRVDTKIQTLIELLDARLKEFKSKDYNSYTSNTSKSRINL